MSLLECEGLSIGHGARVVAQGIGFALEAGTVTVLLGPNGGGKTTLLRTLLGLIPPLAGRVLVAGEDLRGMARQAVARKIAYVPQAAPGGFAYRVLDVVAMGRAAHLPFFAQPGARDFAAARAALARLGMEGFAERRVTELSGGERQKVLIARALAQEAAVVVMDEPAASLDFGNQALLLREARRLAAEGHAVLMTTHHPDHAFLVADRVALLHGGVLEGPGAPAAMVTAERLAAIYGVPAVIGELGGRMVCAPLLGGPD
ncbi:ABC transporter ATP-binding protein [Falsiroseomonas ponticola]|uniref:ABC transporter ATP-binding protein n=1 Tax=Falsiroseomonas ponticola TaxID=2786951 RepID=UPI001CF79C20|nr:ABC transporter ATP-binding protein [Roseomonas ponticola]